jgi:hypothetical protein
LSAISGDLKKAGKFAQSAKSSSQQVTGPNREPHFMSAR